MTCFGQLECGNEHKKRSIRPLSPIHWCSLRRWKGYFDLFHVCNPHLPDHQDDTGLPNSSSRPSAESDSESFPTSICNHDDTQTFTTESIPTCSKVNSKRSSKRLQSQNQLISLHNIIHNNTHSYSRNFHKNQCQVCYKSYATTWEFKLHLNTHTLPFDCPLCGKGFSRPWLLRGHLRTHTGEKPFKCHQCGKAFADKSNLRAHEQTHAVIKKHVCSSCFLSFSRASLLQRHKLNCPHVQTPMMGRRKEGRIS